MEGTPQEPQICRFYRVRSFSGNHFQGSCGFPAAAEAGVPRFCPGDSSTNPELVREEPPKVRNLVIVSRVVPIQKDK